MRRAVLVLATLAACTASPPPEQPPALGFPPPEQWATDAPGSAPALDWWSTFGDPALPALVEEALARNHDLAAAAARLDAAAVQARIAGAALTPALELHLDASRQRQVFVGLPIPSAAGAPPSRTYDRFGVSLVSSWELDLWGRIRAGESAALADAEAAAAQLAGARQSLAAQTVKAYVAAVEARQQVALAAYTVHLFTETVALADDRFARGVRPALDVHLARDNLALAEAGHRARQEQLARARRQLELLLGRYPAGALEPAAALPAVPDQAPAGLPAQLLERRPDVRLAERRLAATEARVEAARAALFPRLALTGSAGTATQEAKDLIDSDFFVWSLAAGLVQPLLAGGRLRGEVALASAKAREAAADYAQAALRAYGEVETALASERWLRERAVHAAAAEREAKAAEGLASDRYRRGLADILTVLEAQQRAVGQEGERIAVQHAILVARIDLHLALGGGFLPPEASAGVTP